MAKQYPANYTRLTPVLGTEKIMAARSSDGKMFWVLLSDIIAGYQATLVSGTNIKTINGNSLLGSGDITIAAGGSPETGTSIRSKLGITTLSGSNTGDQDLSGKQDTLVSGTNLKTVNGNSLLGSGNVTISGAGSPTTDASLLTSGTLADARLSNNIPKLEAVGSGQVIKKVNLRAVILGPGVKEYIDANSESSIQVDTTWLDTYAASKGWGSGSSLPTPGVPTAQIVNDTANTYAVTPPSGYTSAQLETTLDGGATWANNPSLNGAFSIGDVAKAIGQVGTRVKAVSGTNLAGTILYNTTAFTVASGGAVFTDITNWTYVGTKTTRTANSIVPNPTNASDNTDSISAMVLSSGNVGAVRMTYTGGYFGVYNIARGVEYPLAEKKLRYGFIKDPATSKVKWIAFDTNENNLIYEELGGFSGPTLLTIEFTATEVIWYRDAVELRRTTRATGDFRIVTNSTSGGFTAAQQKGFTAV